MHGIDTVIARALEISGKSGLQGKPQPLGGGEINDTYALQFENGEALILRIARYEDQRSLVNEARALSMLNIEQAPRLVFFDADKPINNRLWILESHLDGKTVERLNLQQFCNLGQLLAAVHQNKAASIGINIWEKFLGANRMFGDEDKIVNHPDVVLRRLVASAKGYFNAHQTLFNKVVPSLTHGDATPSNILVRDDKISLIDWEFSSFNDPMAEFSTIYYDDMEYNQGKWRVHASPDEREALFKGYREAGGFIDPERIHLWMVFDKLGAALYLHWRLNESGRTTTSDQQTQYELDLRNLTNSLGKSLC